MDLETAFTIRQRAALIADKIKKGDELIQKLIKLPLKDSAIITDLYPEREKILRYLQSDIKDLIAKTSSEINLRRKVFEKLALIYTELGQMETQDITAETIKKLQSVLANITIQVGEVTKYLESKGL